MRVLFVCGDGIFAGLERITLQLIQEVGRRGHDVMCFGSYWGSGQFTAKIREAGLPLERSWFGFISLTPRIRPMWMTFAQLAKLPLLWRDYRRLVARWRPDVIHFTNFHHVLLLACGPTRTGVPSLYHVHNIFRPTRAARIGFGIVGKYVDRFVAVSHAVADSLVTLGVDRRRISVILNGVAVPAAVPSRSRGWRERCGWTDDRIVVGIVGQVTPAKGHEDFLEALVIARRSNPLVTGVVVGSGDEEYLRTLEERSRRNDLGVVFTGFVEDTTEVFAGLDLLIVASRQPEAFSLVAAEAMASGLPVIGVRRGAIPELLSPDLAELLVEPGSPADIAERILRLAREPETRRALGTRARALAARELRIERCAAALVAEYAAITGSRPAEPNRAC